MAAERDTPACRICMEPEETGGSRLVSPCACAGTQAYVHISCLAKWQSTTMDHTRRCICPVCRTAYQREFVPFRGSDGAAPWGLTAHLRNVLGAAALGVAAYALDASAPVLLAMLAVIVFIALGQVQSLLGFKLCLVVDEDGAPLLRLIGIGSRIPGLATGALLVATDAIGGGIFEQSVIVITRHGEGGTAGYIVNCPIERMRADHPAFESDAPLRHALSVPEAPHLVQHSVGGPVGLDHWVVMHRYADVDGAVALGGGLYLGGDLVALRAHARAAAIADAALDEPVQVRVLHGHAAWASGQLEGEIRSGAWEWAPDLGYEVAMRRAEPRLGLDLWHAAMASVRARGR